MRTKVRQRPPVVPLASTLLALLVLATARLPEPASPGPSEVAAIRIEAPPAPGPGEHGVAIRVGLATLLLAGLAMRLRAEG